MVFQRAPMGWSLAAYGRKTLIDSAILHVKTEALRRSLVLLLYFIHTVDMSHLTPLGSLLPQSLLLKSGFTHRWSDNSLLSLNYDSLFLFQIFSEAME